MVNFHRTNTPMKTYPCEKLQVTKEKMTIGLDEETMGHEETCGLRRHFVYVQCRYHVYKDIWEATVSEKLAWGKCVTSLSGRFDAYTCQLLPCINYQPR